MNITASIAKEIGGDIQQLIQDNPAIQFYWNSSTSMYQWVDYRFELTSNIWLNKDAKERIDLINIFKSHITSII